MTEEYAKLRDFLDNEKARIINKAKQEAKIILNKANRKIENTIRLIKEIRLKRKSPEKSAKNLKSSKKKLSLMK